MATAETALSFNGEIFNHAELARARSLSLRTTSDAEVLLHLLRSHGLAALPELNGFFAISFADFSKGKLWLIRDRFGVKPLYFASSPGLFGFASEIRPLRRLGPFLPDEPTVRHNLIGNWTQGAGTGVQNIHRVLPGCYVEFDLATGSMRPGRWFSLADLRDDALRRELHDCPPEILAERTRAILREAVARRSGGAAPLAVLCSGGLDSGIVTALMHETRPAITAFSIDYPESREWSEYPWARRLCRHLGCELRPVELRGARWRSLFVKTAVHFEYPLWHESSVAIAAIAEDLQRAGFKGVLGGEGADELFGGYDYKYRPQRTAYAAWAGCPPTLSTADPQELVHDPILESLYGAYAPHPADRAYREEVAAMAVAAAGELGTPAEALDAILATELLLFLTIVLCRLDRSLMQYGIEGREPYLDLELARFAFNLPLRVKTCPRTKEILREAAVPWIPAPTARAQKARLQRRPGDLSPGLPEPPLPRGSRAPGPFEDRSPAVAEGGGGAAGTQSPPGRGRRDLVSLALPRRGGGVDRRACLVPIAGLTAESLREAEQHIVRPSIDPGGHLPGHALPHRAEHRAVRAIE